MVGYRGQLIIAVLGPVLATLRRILGKLDFYETLPLMRRILGKLDSRETVPLLSL